MVKPAAVLNRILLVLKAIGSYLWRVCKQTVGLELTKVQHVYWRAVQRRMLLGQLEDLINGNIETITAEQINLPYEIAVALVQHDPAIYNYLVKYLAAKNIPIDCPHCKKKSSKNQKDLVIESFHPKKLEHKMKERDDMIEDEEEYLECRGGFLKQGLRAVEELKDKCQDSLVKIKQHNYEENDTDKDKEIKSFVINDDPDDSDDDDLLFEDLIYDDELHGLIRNLSGSTIGNSLNDEESSWFKIGGKSLRPVWSSIVERIPFLVSNFQFKYIVRTKIYCRKKTNQEKEIRRNGQITKERHTRLKELWKSASRWPLFTYWLMFVQTLILIITLSVHGFGAVGYFPYLDVALVTQTDLSVDVVGKDVVPNIWLGPPQSALILLGANYGPCMRRDQLLFQAIDQDREYEATESGCCVRRDGSGCVQVPSEADCPVTSRSADFNFEDPLVDGTSLYTNRSVCGISPRTCLSPPSSNSVWEVESISDWPICKDTAVPSGVNNTDQHLTCEVTGRPCCVGIQAVCMITTRENCDFLEGRFHQEAFLCSQIDCLSSICGLTPFAKRDRPDQVQRLGLALFLHAGILHLLVSVVFNFIVLRNLEKYLGWLSTAILYIGSGVGGNIVSGLFVPYSPEVGPSAAIFGVISFFLIFIMYHHEMLYDPWRELSKYILIIVILFLIGLLPYVDNFARLGGIVFGTLFSFVHIHHIPPVKGGEDFELFKSTVERLSDDTVKTEESKKCNINQYTLKIVLLVTGLLSLVMLYLVFFVLFFELQQKWNGFTYFNCVIPTKFSDLCLDFSQEIRQRPSSLYMSTTT